MRPKEATSGIQTVFQVIGLTERARLRMDEAEPGVAEAEFGREENRAMRTGWPDAIAFNIEKGSLR